MRAPVLFVLIQKEASALVVFLAVSTTSRNLSIDMPGIATAGLFQQQHSFRLAERPCLYPIKIDSACHVRRIPLPRITSRRQFF
jgi:hypothetical protein